jgi:hypothetical protein
MNDTETHNLEKDSKKAEKKAMIKQVESLFFALEHNLTRDAKNTIWDVINLIKEHYPESALKEEWEGLIKGLQDVINGFEYDLSERSEMKLQALYHNALDVVKKEEKLKII